MKKKWNPKRNRLWSQSVEACGVYEPDELRRANNLIYAEARRLKIKECSRGKMINRVAESNSFRFPDRANLQDKLIFLGEHLRIRRDRRIATSPRKPA